VAGSGPYDGDVRRFWARTKDREPSGSPDEAAQAHGEGLPDASRAALHRRVAWWRLLPDDQRDRLESLAVAFIDRMRWEAARDFAVTDEMRAVVAVNACRLVLGFEQELTDGIDPYSRVTSVILHRSTVRLHGQRSAGGNGVMADGPYALHGQAHLRGPVVLSWSAITSDLFHPRRGRNVVLHEFAHQIDMLDGDIDGMPPLGDDGTRDAWRAVRDREFKALTAQRANPILDEYGATNHAEFFAVVTELFFTRPVELRAEIPDLYAVLGAFFRQDPAALVPTVPPAQTGSAKPSAP
jgi:MtfA peptidase